jgi:undecaprenyl-diphosphatase
MVFAVLANATRDPRARNLLIALLIAFLPSAIIGFFVHDLIKEYLFNPTTVAWALVVGGVIILIIERWNPPVRIEDPDSVPPKKALGVGLAQVLSLFPGVSRSGATIMGARSLGFSRSAATEFSFFLAIPTMFAATGFDLVQSRELLRAQDLPVFAVGFVVSFVTAVIVVRAFLGFVAKHTFVVFAWYRIIFGGLLLAIWGLR